MNSVERVTRTINFKETDRVPRGLNGTSDKNHRRLAAELGASSVREMYKTLGIDIWHVNIGSPLRYAGKKRFHKNMEADYWGIPLAVYKDGDSSGLCPLAEIETTEEAWAYEFPSINDFAIASLENDLAEYGDFAIEGGLWAPIFHVLTWLCGFETSLSNLLLRPEASKVLIGRITDFWIDCAKMILDAANGRIQMMKNCNDFGTQRGLVFSREIFLEFFKPELKRLYEAIKGYGVYVMQHSCGGVSEIIGDFVEIGADVINPVQVSASGMEIEGLAKKYAGKICFYGGIDTQRLLPKGSPELIACETRRTLGFFKDAGGYILCPSQGVEEDISAKSLACMIGAAE